MNTRMMLWAAFFFMWGDLGQAQQGRTPEHAALRALLLLVQQAPGNTIVVKDHGDTIEGDVYVTENIGVSITIELRPGRPI